jgi:peptidoglycan/LPS O-acetylase OafA/YrhL
VTAALVLLAEQFFGTLSRSGPVLALLPAVQAMTVVFLLLSLLQPSRDPLFSILNRRVMMRIGVLSYSLYIWHFLFLFHFAPRVSPFPLLQHWAIWWLPAVMVSVLSYKFLETPFLGLRRKFRRAPADVPA